MKDNLQFRVSAELKNILGRDLITSPDIAILELVKNSYDAHATKVEITFDDDYLCIADNGKGMSKSDLINKWLFVAYSAKSDGTEDKSYRSKLKRHYAGAKGIGRMSCDRLASNLTLTTRSAEENKTEVLHVDWSVFEINKQTEFDTVNIPHDTLDTIPRFPLESTTGTILEFTGLHLPWTREDIKRLRQSLEKMINPFSGTDDNFQIEIIASKMRKDDEKTESFHEQVNGVIENSIADVLKLKTTQIESRIENDVIYTSLTDRGVKMYEIEEENTDFRELTSASVSLFFLNRAAKYNFTAKMGVEPVNYGNIFLFRNGFRILPFGEYNDDSWGLNQRQQQGFKRFLGTRDLFGRVDVETDDVNQIKEKTSRDSGLIQTLAARQLMDYFTRIHRRLERYVVGVLWGEGFVRKDYFVNQSSALKAREQLQEIDKDQESAKHLYDNIGSKVDFMQLIRSLVNDSSITVKYYNEELADIVSNPSETEVIQAQMFDDVRKMAEKTNDGALLEKVVDFERHIDELRRQKEDAEQKAKEEEKKAEVARKKAQEEERKRFEEEQKRRDEERKRKEAEKKQKEAEIDRDFEKQKNRYLESTRTITDEEEAFVHLLDNYSNEIDPAFAKISEIVSQNNDIPSELISEISVVRTFFNKIINTARLITKADIKRLANNEIINISEYVEEYIQQCSEFLFRGIDFNVINNNHVEYYGAYSMLDISVLLDNLISNAKKENADRIQINIFEENGKYIIDFSDSGKGVSDPALLGDRMFELGVTTRYGGSGIGLASVKKIVTAMKGRVSFLGNNIYLNGATFRIEFDI